MNGTPVLERTAAAGLGTLALHKQITIGALNHDAVTFQFNGAIDEAVYANYPMKAAEIAALASDPAAAAGDLDGWAKGTKTIEPDAIVTPPENTSEPSELPTGGTTIYYWPFDESSEDLSHYEMYFDEYDIGLEYTDGAVNQGVDTSFGGALSVPFEEEQDFSCFTISFWMRWDGSAPGYGVLVCRGGQRAAVSYGAVYYDKRWRTRAAGIFQYRNGQSDGGTRSDRNRRAVPCGLYV